VRFLQFNVLARGLSSPPVNGGFVLSPVDSLHFKNYRRYRLLEEILRFSPDVVTLEELDHYDDFFQPLMSKFGYSSIYQPKLGAPGVNIWDNRMTEEEKGDQEPYYSDGSGIFWKRDQFKLIHCTSMNYANPRNGKQWGHVGVIVSQVVVVSFV
jgi:mRNA deadenylase 3'-5' endonuclease subunit Ccr4